MWFSNLMKGFTSHSLIHVLKSLTEQFSAVAGIFKDTRFVKNSTLGLKPSHILDAKKIE